MKNRAPGHRAKLTIPNLPNGSKSLFIDNRKVATMLILRSSVYGRVDLNEFVNILFTTVPTILRLYSKRY